MAEKIVLIDGNSIANRAFYGLPNLTNSKGQHTNAIYGFLTILFKILEEESPKYLCVAFDVKEPTFRHKMYKEYKGTRSAMPEELSEQFPILKDVLKAMGIKIIEMPGFEADDILGTLAVLSEKNNMEVSLVSGDRDLLQIASTTIKIRIPKTKAGKTEVEDYYEQDVVKKYGVTPKQFIDVKGLMGDKSDNIPGVPKVGEVTATRLISQYGSIEGVYENLDQITQKAIYNSLLENKELAELSKKLATIDVDIPLSFNYKEANNENLFTAEAYSFFKKLEFKNLLNKFSDNSKEETSKKAIEFSLISEFSQAELLFKEAYKSVIIAYMFCESGTENEKITGVALSFDKKNVFIQEFGFLTKAYILEKMKWLLARSQKNTNLRTNIGFAIKHDYFLLGAKSDKGFFDVQIAAYLLNPLKNEYSIEDLSQEYLGRLLPNREELLGKKEDEEVDENRVQYAIQCVETMKLIYPLLMDRLKKEQMDSLFEEIEMPTSYILYAMQQEGIKVQREELKEYSLALDGRIQELQNAIHKAAGEEFNINSPKQLGEILFEKLQIKGGKKTKTGYSTAADVLDKLSEDVQIVADVQEYRGLAKLKATYAEGLSNYIGADERIHTTFNQTITATGRISSTEPNLQNIPMRTELGRRIRKVFVPKDGCVFVDADYSQIELRILAHMSKDEQLINAYNENRDIHSITASQVFKIPLKEVTSLQRRNAKAVNFGIIYGISSFGLSQGLSITRKEAERYIHSYFESYPKIKEFLDNLIKDAKENGYSKTIFNRRRPIPELASSNFMQRSFGERVAMNAPIQGTAADIMKIAMILVYKELENRGLQSKLILQIHDELLIETKKSEVEEVKHILEEKMKEAVNFAVSLDVEVHEGMNWYETK